MASTAFPSLSEDRLRTIDQLRQRLNQLSTSLGSLKVDLERNEPLPSWPSLQSSAQIVSHNLSQLMVTFETHREFFNAAHAFPLTTFPAHTQEGLLNQLLRKRLDPSVEDWLKQNDATPTQQEMHNGTQAHTIVSQEDEETRRKLWSEAGPTSNAIVRGIIDGEAFDSDFTMAEQESGIETVNTGLNRKLWEDDGDGEGQDEKDNDKMEDIRRPSEGAWLDIGLDVERQPLPIEQILRAMTTGELPV